MYSHVFTHSFIHPLLVKLKYHSRTQDSSGYTIQTSKNSITVVRPVVSCGFQTYRWGAPSPNLTLSIFFLEDEINASPTITTGEYFTTYSQ